MRVRVLPGVPVVLNVIKQINPSNGCVVVAHPDDEVCCFGGLLLKTKSAVNWHIVCCSYPRNPLELGRKDDFFRACSHIGLSHTYIEKQESGYNSELNRITDLEEIGLPKFDIVLTHGDWGHSHHRSIYRQVLELYKGPIICTDPGGKFVLPMNDNLHSQKIEYLKNYKVNSVKVENRNVEKWEALLHHHKHVRDKTERFNVLNTGKTLNTYNRSWKWTPGIECDEHLAGFIKARGLTNKTIFHFGTGEHHKFGKLVENNTILGITASVEEYKTYMQEIIGNPGLAKRYKVLFGDIYTLNRELLPDFDIVTLFHLCEYSRTDGDYGQMDDQELLHMFIDKLKPEGLICFFAGSNHYPEAKVLVEECVTEGIINFVGPHESVQIYRKPS